MRLLTLVRLYITLLLIFVTQKVVFMLFNMGLADGAPFLSCLAVLWHGLRLDSVTACYLLVLPTLAVAVSYFFKAFPLRKVLSPYYIIVAAVVAVVFVVDAVLYSFWGSKLDANDLIYAAKPKDMLASLPLWAILLGIVVIATVSFHYWRRLCHATPRSLGPARSPYLSLLVLPVAALLFLGMRGSTSQSTATPSYAYFSPYPFCNHSALNPTFNMMHSLFKVQNLETEFDLLPQSEVGRLIADSYSPDPTLTDTLLRIPTPDILLIIWESGGSGMVLNDSVGPCLSRLCTEGVFFSNCYANNFRTDRGLVSLLNGWLGLPTASLMKRPDIGRRLPSLARTLREQGYATSFIYGGDIGFTNMRQYLAENGFDSIVGDQSFPSSYRQSAWGVPDHLLLTPAVLSPASPSLSAVLTLSSHEPWTVPMSRLADPKQNAFAYTDSCIGSLVDSLKLSPRWDSLLVVIVPDHGVTYPSVGSPADPRAARIPLLLLGGAVRQPRVVDRLMNQSDIAATLLAQMHLPIDDFTFSRNVLGTRYAYRRQFVQHAYKNGMNLVTPDTVYTYDCVDRSYRGAADTSRFAEALLQHLYQATARLPL